MKLSATTLKILKNFSLINQSIVFEAGSSIKTMSPQKTIIAVAEIEEDIPSSAIIYDVARFLGVHSLFAESPDIEFFDTHFIIADGNRKTKYVFADKSMVISAPNNEVNLPSIDAEFDIKWDDLNSVIKAAGLLQMGEISFIGGDGKCILSAINSADKSSDRFFTELGDTDDTFNLVIKTENLKIMPNDYKISLSSKGISKFEAKAMKYFIAVESTSTYQKG